MKRKKPSSKNWKIGQVKHFPFDDRHRVPFELPDGVENPLRFSARLNVRTVTYRLIVEQKEAAKPKKQLRLPHLTGGGQ